MRRLHDKIMNIRHRKQEIAEPDFMFLASKEGHRDARNVAAEMAIEYDTYHDRLVNMVAELDELVCYYHGCFPIDRVTVKQRRLNDTMVKARALLGELESKL